MTDRARVLLTSDYNRRTSLALADMFAGVLPRYGLDRDHRVIVKRSAGAWCVFLIRRDGGEVRPTPALRHALERRKAG